MKRGLPEQLKLPSQNKPVLALLIHDIPLRNIVEPLNNPSELHDHNVPHINPVS